MINNYVNLFPIENPSSSDILLNKTLQYLVLEKYLSPYAVSTNLTNITYKFDITKNLTANDLALLQKRFSTLKSTTTIREFIITALKLSPALSDDQIFNQSENLGLLTNLDSKNSLTAPITETILYKYIYLSENGKL